MHIYLVGFLSSPGRSHIIMVLDETQMDQIETMDARARVKGVLSGMKPRGFWGTFVRLAAIYTLLCASARASEWLSL